MQCSVVVPVYNGARFIGACLKSLAGQSVPQGRFEVIVVDDGSTDETSEIIDCYPVQVVYQHRQGAAAARNRGVEAAKGDLVLFTDADCEPAVDWIEAMCIPFADPHVSGAKGVYRTRQRKLVARFVQQEYEDKYRRMAREPDIDFIDTYSAGYRRQIFGSLGGFDTSFPGASVEDQELSFRAAKAGHGLVFQPSAIVFHHHVDTILAYARKKFRIGYWKVLVHTRHPDKMLRDSHTPQILKIQILLWPLLLISVVLAWLWAWMWWVPAVIGVLLLGSTLPFCWRTWPADRQATLVAPGLLLVRAASLGLGFAAGILAYLVALPRSRQSGRKRTGTA